MKRNLLLGLIFLTNLCFGQTIMVEGYTFQEGNRGYLANVYLRITDSDTGETLATTKSDKDGFFSCEIKNLDDIMVFADKSRYKMKKLDIDRLQGGEKLFIKVEMSLEPGYSFEVTLAEKKSGPSAPTNAITGALIEVYNNTERKPILVIDDNVDPDFDVNFIKGNHYTILIRKPGFLSKRMEAFVDVEGCILCFEGVGNVQPGVADNLTDRNAAGVLLANVELEPIFEGKTLEIENIYYDLGKFNITKKAKEQLKKVILLMEDNPNLTLELGSHTDSRGKSAFNKELSEKRAKASVSFIVDNSGISRDRVISRGYGEDQILNKCRDGSNCTESEHSINRRTELKILGIGELSRYKPLAQMKVEEFFEQGLLGEEEIRILEGQSIEEAIAEREGKALDLLSEDTVKESIIKEIVENDIGKKSSDVKVLETEEVEMLEETKDVERIIERVEEKIIEEVENILDVEEKITEIETLENHQVSAPVVEKVDNNLMKDETNLPQENPTSSLDNPNAGLNGVKVVIKKTPTLLEEDSELFKRHSELEVYIADDNSIWYMMGGFVNTEQAENSLKNYIKTTYPDAYIITLVDGIIK